VTRAAFLLSLLLALGGCSDLYFALFGPSDEELAQQCVVSTSELKEVRARVKQMEPYKGADLGECSLIKDDTGHVAVVSIEEPPR
jgi:hypothetical protein